MTTAICRTIEKLRAFPIVRSFFYATLMIDGALFRFHLQIDLLNIRAEFHASAVWIGDFE